MTNAQRSTRTFTDQLAALDNGRSPTNTGQSPFCARRSYQPIDPTGSVAAPPCSVTATAGDEFLTVAEVALIQRFVERHVRRLIADGKLKASHLGRAVRIRRVDLEDYINGCSRPRARTSKRN